MACPPKVTKDFLDQIENLLSGVNKESKDFGFNEKRPLLDALGQLNDALTPSWIHGSPDPDVPLTAEFQEGCHKMSVELKARIEEMLGPLELTCGICLDAMHYGRIAHSGKVAILACGHDFHARCIGISAANSGSNKCPACRR
jgi:hypothetical protein